LHLPESCQIFAWPAPIELPSRAKTSSERQCATSRKAARRVAASHAPPVEFGHWPHGARLISGPLVQFWGKFGENFCKISTGLQRNLCTGGPQTCAHCLAALWSHLLGPIWATRQAKLIDFPPKLMGNDVTQIYFAPLAFHWTGLVDEVASRVGPQTSSAKEQEKHCAFNASLVFRTALRLGSLRASASSILNCALCAPSFCVCLSLSLSLSLSSLSHYHYYYFIFIIFPISLY